MAPPKIRRKLARIEIRKGDALILCPYCHPPHPIDTEKPANCGTVLQLIAVQEIYRSVDCALCGKSNGTLVRRGVQYIHDYDCTPGHRIYTVPPKRSWLAKLLYPMPSSVHRFLVRKFGVEPVKFKDGSAAWDKPQIVRVSDGR